MCQHQLWSYYYRAVIWAKLITATWALQIVVCFRVQWDSNNVNHLVWTNASEKACHRFKVCLSFLTCFWQIIGADKCRNAVGQNIQRRNTLIFFLLLSHPHFGQYRISKYWVLSIFTCIHVPPTEKCAVSLVSNYAILSIEQYRQIYMRIGSRSRIKRTEVPTVRQPSTYLVYHSIHSTSTIEILRIV